MPSTYWNANNTFMFHEKVSRTTADFFKKVSDEEELPQNDYWKRFYFGSRQPTWWETLGKSYAVPEAHYWSLWNVLQHGYYQNSGGVQAAGPNSADLLNLIDSRLANKVRDNEFNLGITLAELPETIGFIASAVKRTAGAVKRAKRGDIKGAIKVLSGFKRHPRLANRNVPSVLDTVADNWLGYSLALRPLVADVENAAKFLEKDHSKERVLTVTTKVARDMKMSLGEEHEGAFNHVGKWGGTVVLTGGYRYKVVNNTLHTLQNLGLTNPLTVAWEIVPLSFVVDWFLPVNHFIQNLQPPLGVEFMGGWRAIRCEGHSEFRHSQYASDGTKDESSMRVVETTKWREPSTGFVKPRVIMPDWRLSKGKMATGMSLLWKAGRKG